ncbi:tetratricopeptide repeat protein [Streptomyces sp. NPDC055105]|uniref:serine/threonine-protein kinase n=1 Tax=Streptomyces sp. NPDC055105 TaxID=3365719 RepID=UPI0037D7C67A
MGRCERPECGRGTIGADGFCTVCGRVSAAGAAVRVERPHPAEPPAPPARVGVAQVRPDPWYGLTLVDDAQAPGLEDPARLKPDSSTRAEEDRFCANPDCQGEVGRSRDGRPGRTSGFCPRCRTPFDFTSVAGLVVADRYDLLRRLGQGSYGEAYLAHDRNLETQVVLKRLAQQDMSQQERDVLVGLRHDAIVRILGYEEEGTQAGEGAEGEEGGEERRTYLVLEYVPGDALSARRGDRLETLLAHGIRVLQALDYVHARQLLHCDVKPLNIMRFREQGATGALDRVRLIDFGAVRSLGDTSPMHTYTPLYAPLPGDAEYTEGPTAGFDLYGLGATLLELCRDRLRDKSAPGVLALDLLLQRATHAGGPARRFTSARQFGEQLSGVVRQVVAAPQVGRRVRRASALFGSLDAALHGGLGAARPLLDWADAAVRTDRGTGSVQLDLPPLFVTPSAPDIAAALPMPLEDPDDPTCGSAVKEQLAVCRTLVGMGEPGRAREELAHVAVSGEHWLRHWYTGLIALLDKNLEGAEAQFADVRDALPGELIPQLALGLCAESRGERTLARNYYSIVFATAPALGAAAFGLARVQHQDGSTVRAMQVVADLTRETAFERAARIAEFRLCAALCTQQATDDRQRAQDTGLATRARHLLLDLLRMDGANHAELSAELAHATFLLDGDRLVFSEAVRALARRAPTEEAFFRLVDRANQLRPEPMPLWRPWLGVRSPGRVGRRRGRTSEALDAQIRSGS